MTAVRSTRWHCSCVAEQEMVHKSRGRDQLEEVIKQLGSVAKLENPPRMEGRFMSMILVGDREAIAEIKRAEEKEAKEAAEAGSATQSPSSTPENTEAQTAEAEKTQ